MRNMAFEEQQVVVVAMHRMVDILVSFPERHLSEIFNDFASLFVVVFTLSAYLFRNESRIAVACNRHGIVIVGTTMNISFKEYAYASYYLLGHHENVGVGDIHLQRFSVGHNLMILTH